MASRHRFTLSGDSTSTLTVCVSLAAPSERGRDQPLRAPAQSACSVMVARTGSFLPPAAGVCGPAQVCAFLPPAAAAPRTSAGGAVRRQVLQFWVLSKSEECSPRLIQGLSSGPCSTRAELCCATPARATSLSRWVCSRGDQYGTGRCGLCVAPAVPRSRVPRTERKRRALSGLFSSRGKHRVDVCDASCGAASTPDRYACSHR